MSEPRLNRSIQNELRRLESQGLLDPDTLERLSERYPTTRWNLLVLVRWFSVLGAVTFAAGIVTLLSELTSLVRLAEVGLAAATVGLLFAGKWLLTRKGMPRAGATAQLLAAMTLQGLVFALAIDFSDGSGNWPAPVGVSAVVVAALAYSVKNRLALILALVDLFIWFGGSTGYVSGWGMYWLGMTYPVRFLAASLVALGVAAFHARRFTGEYQSFSRVYAHFGLLIANLSLWFLALFGWFEERLTWSDNDGERLAFTLLWGVVSGASIVAGSRLGQRVLRSYGLTFLVINAYTFYMQFVAANSGALWFVHLLLIGGSLVATGVYLERRLRARTLPGGFPLGG